MADSGAPGAPDPVMTRLGEAIALGAAGRSRRRSGAPGVTVVRGRKPRRPPPSLRDRPPSRRRPRPTPTRTGLGSRGAPSCEVDHRGPAPCLRSCDNRGRPPPLAPPEPRRHLSTSGRSETCPPTPRTRTPDRAPRCQKATTAQGSEKPSTASRSACRIPAQVPPNTARPPTPDYRRRQSKGAAVIAIIFEQWMPDEPGQDRPAR